MPIQDYRSSCLASDVGTYFKFPLTETSLSNINYFFMDIMFTSSKGQQPNVFTSWRALQLVNTFGCCPLQLEIKRLQNSDDHLNILC